MLQKLSNCCGHDVTMPVVQGYGDPTNYPQKCRWLITAHLWRRARQAAAAAARGEAASETTRKTQLVRQVWV